MFLQAGPRPTQMQRANPRQVQNRAGGYVYEVDRWTMLDRFLLIGTQGGTYYAGQAELTEESTANLQACLDEDGPRVVDRIMELSRAGRAVKQDYGLYALALAACSTNQATRQAAYVAIGPVCRTASTLFQFCSYLRGRRGWSRGLRSAIARWYDNREVRDLAYQMVKYQNRYGYSHRDLLRLAHVKPGDEWRETLYRWAVGKEVEGDLPPHVANFEAAKTAPEGMRAPYAKLLPREALPTEWMNDPAVWEAMLYGEDGRGMPLHALVRNLGNLSKCGVLDAGSDAARYVCGELTNQTRLHGARVHPIAILLAASQYGLGRGLKGSGTWAPVGAVLDALGEAFELAVAATVPTGKSTLVAVDSSGSMQHEVAGMNLSARHVSMAMALVTLRTEPCSWLLGFTDGSNTTEFAVARDERLRDLLYRFESTVKGNGTDCSIPFTFAQRKGIAPEVVLIYTDSETWAGRNHPDAALGDLRRATGKQVKVAIAATTATSHTIGDPGDPGVLQLCGFDAALPQVISAFVGE